MTIQNIKLGLEVLQALADASSSIVRSMNSDRDSTEMFEISVKNLYAKLDKIDRKYAKEI